MTSFDTLVDVVAEGEPGLLYVGNTVAPRHVVLVLPGDGDRMLDVYDPGSGRVNHLRRDAVVEGRLGLSGWDVPWVAAPHRSALDARHSAYAVAPGAARLTRDIPPGPGILQARLRATWVRFGWR